MLFVTIGGCDTMSVSEKNEHVLNEIADVIHNSIGWAAEKDTNLLYACFAHDDELFWFSPRDDGTVRSFKAFTELTENFFMKDEFKAVSYEIKDLIINLSQSGTVAWFHARLDDYNEWNGQPANWEDVRWSGVLEKRDDRWVIVQMHYSEATDKR